MIKSLFEDDDAGNGEESGTDRIDSSLRKNSGTLSLGLSDPEPVAEKPAKETRPEKVEPFEISDPIGKPKREGDEPVSVELPDSESENLLELVMPSEPDPTESPEIAILPSDKDTDASVESEKFSVISKEYIPEAPAETIRKTGLAWSAAIVLFGSVVFMMVLGWFADLRFGTKPWGIVGGIILGSIIGFIQFFRTTAQILNPRKTDVQEHPLFSTQDDEDVP